jgi:hypothetical protein
MPALGAFELECQCGRGVGAGWARKRHRSVVWGWSSMGGAEWAGLGLT